MLLLTRVGYGSKIAFAGGLLETDTVVSGLPRFLQSLQDIPSFYMKAVYFKDEDSQRHPSVRDALF